MFSTRREPYQIIGQKQLEANAAAYRVETKHPHYFGLTPAGALALRDFLGMNDHRLEKRYYDGAQNVLITENLLKDFLKFCQLPIHFTLDQMVTMLGPVSPGYEGQKIRLSPYAVHYLAEKDPLGRGL